MKKKLKCISLGSNDESVIYSVECVPQTFMSIVRALGSVFLSMLCFVKFLKLIMFWKLLNPTKRINGDKEGRNKINTSKQSKAKQSKARQYRTIQSKSRINDEVLIRNKNEERIINHRDKIILSYYHSIC